jgi:hypothetical protein
VFIRARTDEGQEHIFRLVPANSESGFLLNPLVLGTSDLAKLYDEPAAGKRVVSFSLGTMPAGQGYFKQDVGITLESVPSLAPRQE